MHKITAENKGPLANLCGCVLAVWDQPPCRHGEWHKLYTVIKCAPARLTAHTGEENEVSLWSRRLKVGKKRSKLKRDGCCTCLENCSQTIPYKRKEILTCFLVSCWLTTLQGRTPGGGNAVPDGQSQTEDVWALSLFIEGQNRQTFHSKVWNSKYSNYVVFSHLFWLFTSLLAVNWYWCTNALRYANCSGEICITRCGFGMKGKAICVQNFTHQCKHLCISIAK